MACFDFVLKTVAPSCTISPGDISSPSPDSKGSFCVSSSGGVQLTGVFVASEAANSGSVGGHRCHDNRKDLCF